MVPIATKESPKVSASSQLTTYDKAKTVANTEGKRMGTIKVMFDPAFFNFFSGSAFLHWKGAPTDNGFYEICEGNRSFRLMSEGEAKAVLDYNEHDSIRPASSEGEIGGELLKKVLSPRQILSVDGSVLQAVKERRPLVLTNADAISQFLKLSGDAKPDFKAPVIQVDPGHEAAAVPGIELLRQTDEDFQKNIPEGGTCACPNCNSKKITAENVRAAFSIHYVNDVADFACHECGNEWEGQYGYGGLA